MKLFPAIDILDGQAVRLIQGDYNQKTVYNDRPADVAYDFANEGARFLHIVDLNAAKTGVMPPENRKAIRSALLESRLYTQLGGGVRNMTDLKNYLNLGIMRAIIGTAAVTDQPFLEFAIKMYGNKKIAVGVDIKDGKVAINGWTKTSDLDCFEFCHRLHELGVKTIICTDISKDGLMSGTNIELYSNLIAKYSDMDIIASGGITTLDDIVTLKQMGLAGAIVGKAIYTKELDLHTALITAAEVKKR